MDELNCIGTSEVRPIYATNLLYLMRIDPGIGDLMGETASDVKEIKFMLEKIESIIDSRLIGIETPADDEVDAIQDYERRKAQGSVELNEI